MPVGGGRVSLVLTTPALDATVSSNGRQDHLPRLQGLRERLAEASHVCSHARHLGLRHECQEVHAALAFNGEDRNPVFDSNDNDFYYLSEQSGSFNVYKSSLRDPKQSVRDYAFTKHPVRFLTRARTGMLAFCTTASSTR